MVLPLLPGMNPCLGRLVSHLDPAHRGHCTANNLGPMLAE